MLSNATGYVVVHTQRVKLMLKVDPHTEGLNMYKSFSSLKLVSFFSENYNLIIIGGPSENSFADRFLQTIPLTYKQGNISNTFLIFNYSSLPVFC